MLNLRTAFLAILAILLLYARTPAQGILDRQFPTDVRVLSWNVLRGFADDDSLDPVFRRVLVAARPDVIVFQELSTSASTSEVLQRLNVWLPLESGSWVLHRGTSTAGIQTAIASRYALSMQRTDTIPSSATRGVTLALVDLPPAYGAQDLYLLGVHLKCCNETPSDDASRQRSTDAMAKWMGDARLSGGSINLPGDTPMLAVGDFNFVGGPQPELTLRTGDIQDEATFGADVKGDWDNTDITDVMPRDPNTNSTQTWPSTSANPSSRLDRFYFTDSVVSTGRNFILNTRTLTPAQRIYYGLQQDDTATATDHLPIVLDLRYRLVTGALTLGRSAYRCSDTIPVQLVDHDLDLQAAVTIQVAASSGAMRSLELTTAAAAGVFTGTLQINPTGSSGALAVQEFDTLTFTYQDASNASGSPETIIATAEVDCTPPSLLNLQLAARGPRFFTLGFQTNEAATITGIAGTSCGGGGVQSGPGFPVLDHALTFNNLNAGTTYHYRITTTDIAGNSSSHPGPGTCNTVTTDNAIRVVINEVNWNDPSQMELYNAGDESANIGGWRLRSWNFNQNELAVFTFPAGTTIPAGGFITITERFGTQTPTQFFTGIFHDWYPFLAGAVALEDSSQSPQDFVRWHTTSINPPNGGTFTGFVSGISSWTLSRNTDGFDTDHWTDWMSGERTLGAPNSPMPKTTGIHETFDGAGPFDLANTLLTFTPDSRTQSGYTFATQPIASLPETHAGSLVEFTGDDVWSFYRISGSLRPTLFGLPYREFFIESNGYIGLDFGESLPAFTTAEFYRLRRIAALATNLDAARGDVRVQELSNRLVISYQNVPRSGLNDSNNFQIILRTDGRIQIAYGAMAAPTGITGISRGGRNDQGTPPLVDLNGGRDPFLKLPGMVVY